MKSILRGFLSLLALLMAVTGKADASAYQYVTTDSYWPPNASVSWTETVPNDGKLQPEGWTSVKIGEVLHLWVMPEKGWAVDHWRESSKSIHTTDTTCGKLIQGSEDQTNLIWVATNNTSAYLAVKFCYLTYDLAYDGNGGGKTPGQSKVLYTNEVTLAAAPTAPVGYSFTKWKSSVVGTEYAAGDAVSGESFHQLDDVHTNGTVVTLAAQWTANVYGLDCQLSGGAWTNGFVAPTSAAYDSVFSLPPPARTGYDFIGWKVTTNLYTSTARWGTTDNPAGSMNPDATYGNGTGFVYFKNLNPTNSVSVVLTAQWMPSTIHVTFNNHGASEGRESLDVAYGSAYPSLNVPTKTGSAFKGYTVGTELYWDFEGQPKYSVWNIATNCTADAQWESIGYEVIYDENRSDGKTSKTLKEGFEYNKPVELSKGEGFENYGCTLLGWSTLKQAEKADYRLGETTTFYESKTLYAVWEKNFFIAYDGNGATAGEMPVQKLVVGKSNQVLLGNQYARTGYGFLGWATNHAAAATGDWQYVDHQVLPSDYAAVLGQTNTLVATWKANGYSVAFDPNGGTGTPMPALACTYDQPVSLPACTYMNGAYDFAGWSNDVAKVIYTDLTLPVSNLCTTAKGTNTLYATWKLSALSAAMKCDNLRWESYAFKEKYLTYVNEWSPELDGEGVWQTGDTVNRQQWLVTQVPTNGTLSFMWKPVGCKDQRYKLSYWITKEKDDYFTGIIDLEGSDNEWHTCVISNVPALYYVHFYVGSTETRSYCQIDNMTWTPEGLYPEPTEQDAAEISSAAVADGRFVLSFAGTNVFDYVLWTNADLRVDSWGQFEKTNGEETVTFAPPILPEQPQLFYKVETVQKK